MGEAKTMNYWDKLEEKDKKRAQAIAFGLKTMVLDCHMAARRSGWYTNKETGEPIERNPAEMMALEHSEISERLEGFRTGRMNKHLPHRTDEEVQAADLLIRLMDYIGYRKLDIVGAYLEKRDFNDIREDHKLENRRKEGGKAF
jgi:hypothetical protein